jgi:SET domain-containing protein
MTKEELLTELTMETYVAIKPSPVHGIGVFAIVDIPKGCRNMFSKSLGTWIKLSYAEVAKLPPYSQNLVETYCLYDESDYYVPDHGFKIMDLVFYLNHSSAPNIVSINHGEYFEAMVDIPAGTELLINYGEIVEADGYD